MLLGANATEFPLLYPASVLLGGVIVAPLMLLVFTVASVMLSLSAPTVRSAQSRISVLMFAVLIPLVFAGRLIPPEWQQRAAKTMMSESGRLQAMAIMSLFFAVLGLLLLLLAMAKFRRSRLL
jgi:hypothetical protein